MGAGRGKDQTEHQPLHQETPGGAERSGDGSQVRLASGAGEAGALRCERREESRGRSGAEPCKERPGWARDGEPGGAEGGK